MAEEKPVKEEKTVKEEKPKESPKSANVSYYEAVGRSPSVMLRPWWSSDLADGAVGNGERLSTRKDNGTVLPLGKIQHGV